MRIRRLLFSGGTALTLLAVTMPGANAFPGDPDATFSGDGKAVISLGAAAGEEQIEGLVVQPNGRIVGVGQRYATETSDGRALVLRLRSNGTLDPTFSGNGWAIVGVPGDYWTTAVALQPDGKIVVVGGLEVASDTKLVVFRFRASGALDTTFSGDGIRLIDLSAEVTANAVHILPNGKILVAGAVGNGVDADMAIFRLRPGGGTDPTFGTSGRRVIDFEGQSDYAEAIGVDGTGKLLLVGTASDAVGNDGFGIVRLTRGGQPDAAFGGGDGKVRVDVGPGANGQGLGLSFLGTGSILIGGVTSVAGTYGHALVRLTANGTPDGTFGGGTGYVVSDPLAGNDYAAEVVAQTNGKLVFVGGHQVSPGPYEFEVARYRLNGSLDPTFGTGGIALTPFSTYAVAYAGALTPTGKVVAAGRRDDGTDDLTFARYLAA